MLRQPADILLEVLTEAVIELMNDVEALKQEQRDRKTETKDLRSALSQALDPKVYREPETPERQRALARLREHLQRRGDLLNNKPDDPQL